MFHFASALRLTAMLTVAATLSACKEEERGMTGVWLGEDLLVEVLQGGREGEGKYLVGRHETPCKVDEPQVLSIHIGRGTDKGRIELEEDRLSDVAGFLLSHREESDMLEAEQAGAMLRLPEGIRLEEVSMEICEAAARHFGDPEGWAEFKDGFPEA